MNSKSLKRLFYFHFPMDRILKIRLSSPFSSVEAQFTVYLHNESQFSQLFSNVDWPKIVFFYHPKIKKMNASLSQLRLSLLY